MANTQIPAKTDKKEKIRPYPLNLAETKPYLEMIATADERSMHYLIMKIVRGWLVVNDPTYKLPVKQKK